MSHAATGGGRSRRPTPPPERRAAGGGGACQATSPACRRGCRAERRDGACLSQESPPRRRETGAGVASPSRPPPRRGEAAGLSKGIAYLRCQRGWRCGWTGGQHGTWPSSSRLLFRWRAPRVGHGRLGRSPSPMFSEAPPTGFTSPEVFVMGQLLARSVCCSCCVAACAGVARALRTPARQRSERETGRGG